MLYQLSPGLPWLLLPSESSACFGDEDKKVNELLSFFPGVPTLDSGDSDSGDQLRTGHSPCPHGAHPAEGESDEENVRAMKWPSQGFQRVLRGGSEPRLRTGEGRLPGESGRVRRN